MLRVVLMQSLNYISSERCSFLLLHPQLPRQTQKVAVLNAGG